MKPAKYYVMCGFYDEPHDKADSDPYDEGPQLPSVESDHLELDWPEGSWTLHDGPHNGYGGLLWHFTCPGEHRKLWIGAVV